jgi:HEAT repeat protein
MKNTIARYALSAVCLISPCAITSCASPQHEPPRDSSSLQQADVSKVKGLLREMGQGKPGAKEKISDMGSSAVPGLVSSFDDDDLKLPAVRMAGELAEQDIGLEQLTAAASKLIRLLGDDDWQVREAAAFTIESIVRKSPGEQRFSKATPALVENLGDEKPEVRKSAAWALRILGDASAAKPLVELLGDDEMYPSASEALVAIGMPAVSELLGCLANEALKNRCARTIGEMGHFVVPEVMNTLTHDNPGVRERSAWILGMIADPTTVPRLREVAEQDPDESVRNSASIAVIAIPLPQTGQ